jgi:murein DD-endopeptidase MepM/ murein hydrolase activator NlpD
MNNPHRITLLTVLMLVLIAPLAKTAEKSSRETSNKLNTGNARAGGGIKVPKNAVPLGMPSTTERMSGPYTLAKRGKPNWFTVQLTAGQEYFFRSIGSSDVIGGLYSVLPGRQPKLNLITSDDDSGGNFQFRISFTPAQSGIYYLQVIPFNKKVTSSYTLGFGQVASGVGMIGSGGGDVTLPAVGTVIFPPGAFNGVQLVMVMQTNEPPTTQNFQVSATFFRASNKLSYDVKVMTGNVRPATGVQLLLTVPTDFLNSLPLGSDIQAFVQIFEDGGEEKLDNFELVPSTFDPVAQTVQLTMPKEAFTNQRHNDGTWELVVTLAATPGAITTPAPNRKQSQARDRIQSSGDDSVETVDRPAGTEGGEPRTEAPQPDVVDPNLATDSCQGTSLGSPLDGAIQVNRPFNPAGQTHPITGSTAPHYGVDLNAAVGANVRAVADGKVEVASFQFNPDNLTGWGNYIVLRHLDGSATLYAHLLSGTLAAQGATMTKGQVLGQADTSGGATGPHLHLEYAPNGQIFAKATKVDPFPCIGTNLSTSITVGDNGNVADDSFGVYLDGLFLGQTTLGGTNTLAAGNLRPGSHTLTIVCVVAPDNIGTLGVSLADGVTFTDGSTTRSETLEEGAQISYDIIVPF